MKIKLARYVISWKIFQLVIYQDKTQANIKIGPIKVELFKIKNEKIIKFIMEKINKIKE